MFPYIAPDQHEFATYCKLRDKSGKYVDKTNKEILIEGGAEMVYNKYRDYYEGDPLIGPQDQVLAAPPIDKIYAIYGINLKTETFYFFKPNTKKTNRISELVLDTKVVILLGIFSLINHRTKLIFFFLLGLYG
jgi:hypothetical protein